MVQGASKNSRSDDKIPKYLISPTQHIDIPDAQVMGAQQTWFLGPIRIQQDLSMLTAISVRFNSTSQLTNEVHQQRKLTTGCHRYIKQCKHHACIDRRLSRFVAIHTFDRQTDGRRDVDSKSVVYQLALKRWQLRMHCILKAARPLARLPIRILTSPLDSGTPFS